MSSTVSTTARIETVTRGRLRRNQGLSVTDEEIMARYAEGQVSIGFLGKPHHLLLLAVPEIEAEVHDYFPGMQ